MENICEDCTPAERLVLSEVHIGSSSLHEEAEVVSRYAYLTPTSGDNEDSGSDSDSDSEEQTRPRVARHRKRPRHEVAQRCCRPSHEVLTIVHKMATTLGLVGQQVWSASFLLGDFVLTHDELFAGMQVHCSFRLLAQKKSRALIGRCCTIHRDKGCLGFRQKRVPNCTGDTFLYAEAKSENLPAGRRHATWELCVQQVRGRGEPSHLVSHNMPPHTI